MKTRLHPLPINPYTMLQHLTYFKPQPSSKFIEISSRIIQTNSCKNKISIEDIYISLLPFSIQMLFLL